MTNKKEIVKKSHGLPTNFEKRLKEIIWKNCHGWEMGNFLELHLAPTLYSTLLVKSSKEKLSLGQQSKESLVSLGLTPKGRHQKRSSFSPRQRRYSAASFQKV